MVDAVEVFLNINFDNPPASPALHRLPQRRSSHCVLVEIRTSILEIGFEQRFDHHPTCLLDN